VFQKEWDEKIERKCSRPGPWIANGPVIFPHRKVLLLGDGMIRRIFAALIFVVLFAISSPLLAANKATARILWTATPFHGVSVVTALVDGKSAVPFFSLNLGNKIDVAAGTHSFLLSASFPRGFLRGLGVGKATVKANLAAGGTYQSVGAASGDLITVWLIDVKSGQRISSVGSVKYSVCTPGAYTVC